MSWTKSVRRITPEEALDAEVIRKLQLASEAETKEDREMICEELFCDITGALNLQSQERLGLPISSTSDSPSLQRSSSYRTPLARSYWSLFSAFSRNKNSKEPSLVDRPSSSAHSASATVTATGITALNDCPSSSAPAASASGGHWSPSPTNSGHDMGNRDTAFYEVLAKFYQGAKDKGEAVACLCQKLWGQAYAAPIFALLLHRWLLLNPDSAAVGTLVMSRDSAGYDDRPDQQQKEEQGIITSQYKLKALGEAVHRMVPSSMLPVGWRDGPEASWQKHQAMMSNHYVKLVGVLVLGVRLLFQGDAQAGHIRFKALYRCLLDEVLLGPGLTQLSEVPQPAKRDLMGAVVAALPFYSQPSQMPLLIGRLASGTHGIEPTSVDCAEQQQQQQQKATALLGLDVDFLISEFIDMLGKIRNEAGMLKYLSALTGLKGCVQLKALNPITSLRLQSELYALTSPGGPYYAPRSIQLAAMSTLDATYPMGRRTRRVVRAVFRLFHPTDWLGEFWIAPFHWWTALYSKAVLAALWLLYRLLAWRSCRPPQTRRPSSPGAGSPRGTK
ncbi:hypothetical protein CEUSTIGMA_g6980.t1 [Chlamydomonas eustigma]|uniref:Uncharacterized protein n=1 Tax=Chlamydomonas eustigma TaxID=1157962 RepID=A0A250X9G1_9CHLO|nr:hypothetical protein CEUSTIGMA_g6980.t1 [Chlamydomonas eustigma]|eukprot:GAX79539.1 hypothetical protein CEUSTIGMA_g6980.t1 [Chlamydomonas eustigma]